MNISRVQHEVKNAAGNSTLQHKHQNLLCWIRFSSKISSKNNKQGSQDNESDDVKIPFTSSLPNVFRWNRVFGLRGKGKVLSHRSEIKMKRTDDKQQFNDEMVKAQPQPIRGCAQGQSAKEQQLMLVFDLQDAATKRSNVPTHTHTHAHTHTHTVKIAVQNCHTCM